MYLLLLLSNFIHYISAAKGQQEHFILSVSAAKLEIQLNLYSGL